MRENTRMRTRYVGPGYANEGVVEPEEDGKEVPPFTRHVLGPLTVLCGPIQESCGSKLLVTVPSGNAVVLYDQSGGCGGTKDCDQCDKAAHRGKLFSSLKAGDVIVCCNAILAEEEDTTNSFCVLDSVYQITNGAAVSLGSWKENQK